MVEQYIDSLHMESCGHARETEDEGEHTGVSEVQQHIFLPFYHLLVMTATTEAYKSMRPRWLHWTHTAGKLN